MKAIYKHIAFAALALSAVACSQDDEFALSYLSDPDAVRITAQVGTADVTGGFTRSNPLGTAEEQAQFNSGDQISVTAGTQAPVTYQLDTDGWKPVGETYLKWQTNEMNVTAYYPVGKNNASATTFTVPTEYTDEKPIAEADYMTYSGTQTKGDDKSINLEMQRKMVRLVITPEFNDQFATGYSVTTIKVHANTKGYADGLPETGDITVTALKQDDAFYALLAPTTEATAAIFLTVTVSNGTTSQDLTVKGIPATTAGNSYSFALTVGKDMVTMGTISVKDWTGATIEGGEAGEIFPTPIDATSMSADDLNAAVAEQLAIGFKSVEVTLPETPDAAMFTAIRRAICDAENVSDGSIHLTLKGVTSIPGTTHWDGVAFGSVIIRDETGGLLDTEDVTQLASVNLPDVTEIGAEAFFGCSNLTSIIAPKVQSIGDGGLQRTAITSIDMPLLKEAGAAAFQSTALTEVSLPSLETAEAVAFGGCEQLRTVDLPKLQNLSQQLFIDCTSLVSVSVPAATSMSNEVFRYCSELVSITLPGVTELLTYGGFAGCTKLENITLGSVITNVDEDLFAGEALSSNITLTLHPDQTNAEGNLKATAGTNVEWGGFAWKEVKFSATE